MTPGLDANELALLRNWLSADGLRFHSDHDLRLEQLMTLRSVVERSLSGIEYELRAMVNTRGTPGSGL
jgi:hypothetical protein